MKKVLFLYVELSGYLISCLHTLADNYDVEVTVIHRPPNSKAPFSFQKEKNISFHLKSSIKSLNNFVNKLNPHIICVSGWMDKDYLKICKRFKKKIPVISCIDTNWKGTLKQKIVAPFFNFLYQRYYTHFWISGKPQIKFLTKMKVPKNKIIKGFYSANVKIFNDAYNKFKKIKERKYPHNMLFVGRLIDKKGIKELYESFSELDTDWTLTLIGTGNLKNKLKEKKNIFIKGFIQPNKLPNLTKDAGIFILPSKEEPWGVVIHEFASSGIPIICSDNCGAATMFVKKGRNGFIFKSNNKNSIKSTIKKMISLSDKQLLRMGKESLELSKQITPESWASTLYKLI
jgi:glycosyltransferase involved in cell wall biosynthesis